MIARKILDHVLAPIIGETGEMMRARLRREIQRDAFSNLVPIMLEARTFGAGAYVGALEDAIEAEPFVPSEEGAA